MKGKKTGEDPYFLNGATIIAPVEGRVTFVDIIEDRFEIRVRDNDEPIFVLYYPLVYLMTNNNEKYEIDALSTHPPEIVVKKGDLVKIGDPLIRIREGKGVAGCFVRRDNWWVRCER